MIGVQRVQVYWRGRDEGADRLAERLAGLLERLAEVHPSLSPWLYSTLEGVSHRIDGRAACRAALDARPVRWEAGGRELTSFQPRLVLDDDPGRGEIRASFGIPPLEPAAIFVANRLTLLLGSSDAFGHVDTMRQLFRVVVEAFEADFGYVGSPTVPSEALPVFSDGVPPVGWMTFLGRSYGPIGPLPSGAVEYPIASGSIVVAMPEVFDDHHPEHLAKVEAVRTRLGEAGVLKPAAEAWARP